MTHPQTDLTAEQRRALLREALRIAATTREPFSKVYHALLQSQMAREAEVARRDEEQAQ